MGRLKEDYLGDGLRTDLGVEHFQHPRFSHYQFMLQRSRSKAHEKLTLAHIHLLGFEGNGLAHHPLPTGYYRYLVKLTAEAVGPY